MTCHIVTKINTRQQSPADQISPLLLPLHLHNSFNSQMQPSAELGFLLRLLFTQFLSNIKLYKKKFCSTRYLILGIRISPQSFSSIQNNIYFTRLDTSGSS